jgi:hypothetical protein
MRMQNSRQNYFNRLDYGVLVDVDTYSTSLQGGEHVVYLDSRVHTKSPFQGVCYMEDRDRRPLEDGGQRGRLAKNEVETNLKTVCGRKSGEIYHRIY